MKTGASATDIMPQLFSFIHFFINKYIYILNAHQIQLISENLGAFHISKGKVFVLFGSKLTDNKKLTWP